MQPVTKITNKIPITGPCLCNCGSSNQCYTGMVTMVTVTVATYVDTYLSICLSIVRVS